jgi:hypothetical protein
MEKLKLKRGKKPINAQAMTLAERQQKQRDKLKESGGRVFTVTIAGDLMVYINALVDGSEGKKTTGELLREITERSVRRRVDMYLGAIKIDECGGTLEDIKRFYVDNRERPLTDINDYLPKDLT